jgi:hypothetical protein
MLVWRNLMSLKSGRVIEMVLRRESVSMLMESVICKKNALAINLQLIAKIAIFAIYCKF